MLRPLKGKAYARFWSKVEKTDGCWIWRASVKGKGYGQFRVGKKNISAHRVSYEAFIGIIPNDLEIDHLCGVKRCVNPSHLQAVVHQENISRIKRSNPPCPHGNVVKRRCRACRTETVRQCRARKLALRIHSKETHHDPLPLL